MPYYYSCICWCDIITARCVDAIFLQLDVLMRYCYSCIIIIIIKKGRQCKAEREWYTPYQSEDQSPTIPTYRQKEEKEKKSKRL